MAEKKKQKSKGLLRMPEIEIFPNFARNPRKFSRLVKKLAKQNLGLFIVMAAKKPNQTVKKRYYLAND